MINIDFTEEEIDILGVLLGNTRDDPRKHGVIGTCFWRMNFTAEDQARIQEIFSSIEHKVKSAL